MSKTTLPLIPIDGKEDVDYINISIHTPSSIGRKLAFAATFNSVNTLIGKITCLRTAMDFVVTPMYPRKLLTKNRLSYKDISRIPKGKEVKVINYLAILTHLTYARLMSDEVLLNSLLKMNEDVIFTSFNVDKNTVFGMNSKVTQYNYTSTNYVAIINSIFKVLKATKRKDWNVAIKNLIEDSKIDTSKKLFAGVPFEIEFEG